MVLLGAGCEAADRVLENLPGVYEDPPNDCGANPNSTVDRVAPETDIRKMTSTRPSPDRFQIEVEFAAPIPEASEYILRYGCSVTPDPPDNTYGFKIEWSPSLAMWLTDVELGLPPRDHEPLPEESIGVADGKLGIVLVPPFDISFVGCSAETSYGPGERCFDKTSSQPAPPP